MSEENVELVRSVLDGWERGDFGAGQELRAKEFEWQQHPEAVEPGTHRDDAIGNALRRIFAVYRDFRVTAEEFIDAGDRVVVVGRTHGISRATGMPVEQRFAFVWTVRDGQLVRNEVYSDRAQALEAAGLRK